MLEKYENLKSSYDFNLKCRIDSKQITVIKFYKGCPHSINRNSFSVDINFLGKTGTSIVTNTKSVLNSISSGVPFNLELEIGSKFNIEPIEVKIIQ